MQASNFQYGLEVAAFFRNKITENNVKIVTTTTDSEYDLQYTQNNPVTAKFKKINVNLYKADDDDFVGEKISPDLRELMDRADANDRLSIVLQSSDINNPLLKSLLSTNQANVIRKMPGLNSMEVEVPVWAIENLSASRTTGHLSSNRPVANLGHIETTTGVASARQTYGESNLNGENVGIVVIDSGLNKWHKSFQVRMQYGGEYSRVVLEKNYLLHNQSIYDEHGHGTHVAGLAAGDSYGNNPGLNDYRGVAPKAKIISLRVLNWAGEGRAADVLAALNWVYENRNDQSLNMKVVNLSLGTPAVESYRNDPLCRAVRKLVDAGIVVVAAAGNDGKTANGNKIYGRIHSPGNEPSAITVGASNTFQTDSRSDDGVTTYSSRGPTRSYWTGSNNVKNYDHLVKPDLVAPGNKLYSAFSMGGAFDEQNQNLVLNNYVEGNQKLIRMSGSSMATPIVSGTVALMLQANPKLTPNMVKMILGYTAQPLAGFNQLEQGAGELNIEGAIRLAKNIRQDMPSPTPFKMNMLNSSMLPTQYTTIANHRFNWSGGMILNNGFIKGTNLIKLYQKVYNSGLMLSDGVMLSDGLMLSDGAMLSDGLMLSDGVMMSDGRTISDGFTFLDYSSTFGNGVMLSDGVMMSDGVMLSDGAMLSDSTQSLSVLNGGD